MEAMLTSLRHAGVTVVADSFDADAVIIWSVLWAGRMSGNQRVYAHYRSQGRPVIVADIGTLCRGTTWKIALDNINALGWYGNQQDLDPDRAKKLGIRLNLAPHRRPEILIAAQHPRSLQVEHIDMATWITITYNELRRQTDRPIILRSHPRGNLPVHNLPPQLIYQRPLAVPGTYDSFDFDTNYHAVVNYNSGPGILAAISGVPPITHSSSLASPVAISIEHIEQPYLIDRDRWLLEIAHTEYTLDEIQQGEWLKRLNSKLCVLT